MRRQVTIAFGLCLVAVTGFAKPEYFEHALELGARDCSFCHAGTGGEALNERGSYLVDERDRRGVNEVDVSWLVAVADRFAMLDAGADDGDPVDGDAIDAPVAALSRLTHDRAPRPFDYTTRHGDWPAYGGDVGASKYSPLGELNSSTVGGLAVAWTWNAAEERKHFTRLSEDAAENPRGDSFKGTPIMAEGKVFLRTRFSDVVAIDAISGETLWVYDPGTATGPRPAMFGFTTRGLAYHRDAAGGRVVLLTSDGYLVVLDAVTGKPIDDFGTAGRIDLTQGLRREIPRRRSSWSYPPAVCGDVVVVGNQASDGSHRRRRGDTGDWNDNLPLGDVRGFDVHTGAQRWVFHTVPQAGEFGVETWGDDSWRWMGNTNAWSMMSCDSDRSIVYLPLSAPTHHFFGGFRPGDNLFANSVVALDAETGERLWHQQLVHHDIWDYDLPAAPVVADVEHDGQRVPVVAQVTKMGFLFVFDRITGEPLWPIEERSVPESSLVGEHASPTQPFPTWPEPFEMQGLADEDLNDLTPELLSQSRALIENLEYGPMYQPPSENGSVVSPGWGGGGNWGGASFDPEAGVLYVPSRRMPIIATATKVDEGYGYRVRPASFSVGGLPAVRPPWSSITAYELGSGEKRWSVANGPGPKDHPMLAELDLPDLGEPGAAPGMLLTKHLLFLGGSRPARLRALDKRDGREVWQHPLAGRFTSAPPMTYQAGGRQFVVIGTGGPTEPTRLTAFRLP